MLIQLIGNLDFVLLLLPPPASITLSIITSHAKIVMLCLILIGQCCLLQPTGIVLASGVKYQLVYDSLGNLVDVVTPGGQVHSFHMSMNIGFVRHTYAMSGRLYIEDVSSLGQMFRRVYPSDYR